MLEARVGSRLFEKNKRPLQPTELCLALAAEGRKVLAANKAASDVVKRYLDGRSGVVRVGGSPIFMDGVISGMIAEFQNGHPDVRIDQSYNYAQDLMEKLEAGNAGCRHLPDENRCHPKRFHVQGYSARS
jgi:DNA-binding transcriptional LysR family regulator